ncbi:MAG: 4Fe-4S binding protein [Caldimicrobium sp.]
MKDFFKGKFTLTRRLFQIGTFLFFLAVYYTSHKQSFLLGTFYSFKLGPIHIVDPFIYLTYLGRNLLKADLFVWTVTGFLIPLLIAFLFGRVFCSWICPYNFLYEILDFLKTHLFRKKPLIYFEASPKSKKVWLALALALGIFIPPFPYYILMPGLLSVLLHQLVLHLYSFILFSLLLILMVLFVDLFFKKRIWCKFICPTGLILGMARWKGGLRIIKRKDLTCKECALCSFECPLGLTPHLGNHLEDCYNCGRCVDICKGLRKKENPLDFKFL